MGKEIQRILAIQGNSSYGALNYFVDSLVYAWKKMGISVTVIPAIAETIYEEIQGGYDAIITMNGMGVEANYNERRIIDCTKIPWYSFYVDHPLYHGYRLEHSEPAARNIFTDPTFTAYVDRYYSFYTGGKTVMQGGVTWCNNGIGYRDRKNDIVFFGSYSNYRYYAEQIESWDPSMRAIFKRMLYHGLTNAELTIEMMLEKTLVEAEADLSDMEFRGIIELTDVVEKYLRGKYREELICELVNAGIVVGVYGDGWETVKCEGQENLRCHVSIDYKKMIEIMGDSRIVLNVMPWSKGGVHDRLINAMLSGALVLSDNTSYLLGEENKYHHMLLYDLSDPKQAVKKIKYYLKHEAEAEKIALRGYDWALNGHTWEHRAEEILSIMRN